MNSQAEQDKADEGDNLRHLLRNTNKARFAREYGLNPSMIGQQIRGERPISLAYAKTYAKALGKTLAEVSPYWASQANLDDVAVGTVDVGPAQNTGWPFSPDLLDQILALDPPEQAQVEGAIRLILALLAALPQTHDRMVEKILNAKPTTSTADIIKSKVK